MNSIIDSLRQVVGTPVGTYAAELEYMLAGLVLLVVVSSVFKLLTRIFYK